MIERDRLLFIGHFGGANTGDEAMLAGLLTWMSAQERERVVVMAKAGMEDVVSAVHGICARPATVRETLRVLTRARMLVLVGGTHLHDDYSSKRYRRHVWYMARIALLGIAARLTGVRVLWLGVGVGPTKRVLTRIITRIGAACCHVVTVRDEASQVLLRKLWPGNEAHCGFDLAAALATELPVRGADRTVVGISITSVNATEWGNESSDRELWARFALALQSVLDRHSAIEIRVFSIRGGRRESDVQLSDALVRNLRMTDDARFRIVPYEDDPRVMLREIAECTHFIATRFHAGVLAYLAECHLLLLAYHDKVADLGERIGLPAGAIVSLKALPSSAELETAIEQLLSPEGAFHARLPVPEAVAASHACALPLTG